MITQSLGNSVSALTDLVRTTAGSLSWGPMLNISRTATCAILSRVEHGRLVITDTDDTVLRFGDTQADPQGPKVELKVHREAFWVRLFLFADMVRPPASSLAFVSILGQTFVLIEPKI